MYRANRKSKYQKWKTNYAKLHKENADRYKILFTVWKKKWIQHNKKHYKSKKKAYYSWKKNWAKLHSSYKYQQLNGSRKWKKKWNKVKDLLNKKSNSRISSWKYKWSRYSKIFGKTMKNLKAKEEKAPTMNRNQLKKQWEHKWLVRYNKHKRWLNKNNQEWKSAWTLFSRNYTTTNRNLKKIWLARYYKMHKTQKRQEVFLKKKLLAQWRKIHSVKQKRYLKKAKAAAARRKLMYNNYKKSQALSYSVWKKQYYGQLKSHKNWSKESYKKWKAKHLSLKGHDYKIDLYTYKTWKTRQKYLHKLYTKKNKADYNKWRSDKNKLYSAYKLAMSTQSISLKNKLKARISLYLSKSKINRWKHKAALEKKRKQMKQLKESQYLKLKITMDRRTAMLKNALGKLKNAERRLPIEALKKYKLRLAANNKAYREALKKNTVNKTIKYYKDKKYREKVTSSYWKYYKKRNVKNTPYYRNHRAYKSVNYKRKVPYWMTKNLTKTRKVKKIKKGWKKGYYYKKQKYYKTYKKKHTKYYTKRHIKLWKTKHKKAYKKKYYKKVMKKNKTWHYKKKYVYYKTKHYRYIKKKHYKHVTSRVNTVDSNYIGCYRDRKSRDLYKYIGNSYTPATCKAKCTNLRFKYASVQFYGECYCDNNYGKYGKSSGCRLRCRRDKSKICGGHWANSVYRTTYTNNNIVKKIVKTTTLNDSNYIGCYRDKKRRDLYKYLGKIYTPATCKAKCASLKFKYASVQFYGECYCDNDYGKYGKANNCNLRCRKDKTKICGGHWANSVYRTTLTKILTSRVIVKASNDPNYIGCYRDKKYRDVYKYLGRGFTPKTCKARCAKLRFKYASVQHFGQCFCDNDYGKYGKANNCNLRCRKDKTKICGGHWANSVYKTNVQSIILKLPANNDKNYVGCYKDKVYRDLYKYVGKHYTPVLCRARCDSLKFKYASVQFFGQCFCDNNFGKYGKSNNCRTRCKKDKSKICGGVWANSVYTAIPTKSIKKLYSHGSSIYVGCYKDKHNRDLKKYLGYNFHITKCRNACKAKKYKYASLQWYGECFCSNTYGKYGKAYNCNTKCAQKSSEICGGAWANSVYLANGSSNSVKIIRKGRSVRKWYSKNKYHKKKWRHAYKKRYLKKRYYKKKRYSKKKYYKKKLRYPKKRYYKKKRYSKKNYYKKKLRYSKKRYYKKKRYSKKRYYKKKRYSKKRYYKKKRYSKKKHYKKKLRYPKKRYYKKKRYSKKKYYKKKLTKAQFKAKVKKQTVKKLHWKKHKISKYQWKKWARKAARYRTLNKAHYSKAYRYFMKKNRKVSKGKKIKAWVIFWRSHYSKNKKKVVFTKKNPKYCYSVNRKAYNKTYKQLYYVLRKKVQYVKYPKYTMKAYNKAYYKTDYKTYYKNHKKIYYTKHKNTYYTTHKKAQYRLVKKQKLVPHNVAYYVNQKYNVKHRVKSYKIVNGKKRVAYYYKKKYNRKQVYYTTHKKKMHHSKYVWKTQKQAYYKKHKYIKDYKKIKSNLYKKAKTAYNLYQKEKKDARKNYKNKAWQLSLTYRKSHMVEYLAWKKKWSGVENKNLKALNNSWVLYLKKNVVSYTNDLNNLKANSKKITSNLRLNYRKNQNSILKGWKSGTKKNRYNHIRIIKRDRKIFYLKLNQRKLALKNKLASLFAKFTKEKRKKNLEHQQKINTISANLKSATSGNKNKYSKEFKEYLASYKKSQARDTAFFNKQRKTVTKYYKVMIKKSRNFLAKKIALEKAKWAARLRIQQRTYRLKWKLAIKRKAAAYKLWNKTVGTLKSRHWKKYKLMISKRETEMAKWKKGKALKHKKLMDSKKNQYLVALKKWKVTHKKLQAENNSKYNKLWKNWTNIRKYTLLKNKREFLTAKKTWLKSWAQSKKQFRKVYLASKKRHNTMLLKKKGELAAKYILSKRVYLKQWKKDNADALKSYQTKRNQSKADYETLKNSLNIKYTRQYNNFLKKNKKLLKYYQKIYKRGIKIDTRKVFKQIANISKKVKSISKILKTQHSLRGIKPTITTYKTTTNSNTTYSIKRTCAKKIYAYLKSETKYRCVSYNTKYSVSSCKMTDGDTGECTEKIQLKGTRVCSKWFNMSGTIKCVRHITVWPKYRCDESNTVNNKPVCTKKTYFNPRFYCTKYKIWNGKRICEKRSVYYGKNHNTFKCVKMGVVIQKSTKILLGATKKTTVSGCLKYKKELKPEYKNLQLINVKTTITWWNKWVKKNKKSKILSQSNDSSYIGCYRDKKYRDLYKYLGRGYTPATCKAKCGALKFKYASVQHFSQCFCDNNYGKYGKAKNCNLRCRKDKTKICGGAWANSVYQTNVAVAEKTILLGATLKSECSINEKKNKRGAHRCYKSNECQGKRYCSTWGWCHGSSKCSVPKKFVKIAAKKPTGCSINEKTNKRGPHRCYRSSECNGKRYCSKWGWCHGKSYCGRKLRSYRYNNLPKSFTKNLKKLLPKLNKKDKKLLEQCF